MKWVVIEFILGALAMSAFDSAAWQIATGVTFLLLIAVTFLTAVINAKYEMQMRRLRESEWRYRSPTPWRRL